MQGCEMTEINCSVMTHLDAPVLDGMWESFCLDIAPVVEIL